MGYIDAEKLIAEIKRLHKAHSGKHGCDEVGLNLEYLEDFIESLQQEQPDGYNRAMLEVKKKVDDFYEETSIGLNEYDAGLYNGIAETCMKLRGFIKARISSQEQPEVDSLIRCELPDMEDNKSSGLCYCNQFGNHRMTIKDVREIARHFYELGLNARKEE